MADAHLSLKDQIAQGLKLLPVIKADGKITWQESLMLGAEVAHVTALTLMNMADPVGGKEELIAAGEAVYDEHVAPIDISWIPNTFEPVVDKAGRSMIRPLITSLVDQIGA